MISEEAQSSFAHIFKSAVTTNFCDYYNAMCEIDVIDDHKEITETEFSVLTITSTSFRFLTLLHFDTNESTIKYFANGSITDQEHENDNDAFLDQILEFCNLACGAMNRHLNDHYTDLNPGYIKHYRITINPSLILHATLCVCNFGNVDFSIDKSKADEITGELQML